MQMTTTTSQPRATKITHRSSDTTHVFEYGVGRSWFEGKKIIKITGNYPYIKHEELIYKSSLIARK
jgi:hypothetical protein